jgi:hypothetical protein
LPCASPALMSARVPQPTKYCDGLSMPKTPELQVLVSRNRLSARPCPRSLT